MGLLPDDLGTLAVVAVSTAVFYALTLIGLRLAGRRTLTEMSAFDWVVTVAIGSMIANTSVNEQVSVSEGAVGVGVLLVMQVLFAAARRGSRKAERVLDFAPVVVIADGKVSPRGLRQLQMTRSDLMGKLRTSGNLRLDHIRFGIIESTGDLTVIPEDSQLDAATSDELGTVLEEFKGL